MLAQQIRRMIEQAQHHWESGDADAFAALFTLEGELIVPGQRWVGPEQIKRAVSDFSSAVSNVQIHVHRIIVDGNQAVVVWHWQERDRATEQLSQAEDAIVIDFQGDRISCWREYIDTQSCIQTE